MVYSMRSPSFHWRWRATKVPGFQSTVELRPLIAIEVLLPAQAGTRR